MLDAKAFLKGKKIYVSLLIVSLLVVFAVVAANHLWNQTNSGSSNETVEAIQYPVKLVMKLNKTTYSLGEIVNITIEIVNISNSTIEVGWQPPSIAMFTIYDKENTTIYNSASASTLPVAIKKLLKPGESWGEILMWGQKDEEGDQVPAGEYYIIAETPTPYGGIGVTDYDPIRIKTPALTITIQ